MFIWIVHLSMAYHEKPSVISLIKGFDELVNEFRRKEIDLNLLTLELI